MFRDHVPFILKATLSFKPEYSKSPQKKVSTGRALTFAPLTYDDFGSSIRLYLSDSGHTNQVCNHSLGGPIPARTQEP
jgi:hypothetical protein